MILGEPLRGQLVREGQPDADRYGRRPVVSALPALDDPRAIRVVDDSRVMGVPHTDLLLLVRLVQRPLGPRHPTCGPPESTRAQVVPARCRFTTPSARRGCLGPPPHGQTAHLLSWSAEKSEQEEIRERMGNRAGQYQRAPDRRPRCADAVRSDDGVRRDHGRILRTRRVPRPQPHLRLGVGDLSRARSPACSG